MAELGATVIGISPDAPEALTAFSQKFELPYRLLSDPAKTVMKRYGAFGEKLMYGKTVIGVIRSTVWVGLDGKVRKHWQQVTNAEKHPSKVLEAIRAAAG